MTKHIMHLLGYLLIINIQNDNCSVNVGAKFTFSLYLLLMYVNDKLARYEPVLHPAYALV